MVEQATTTLDLLLETGIPLQLLSSRTREWDHINERLLDRLDQPMASQLIKEGSLTIYKQATTKLPLCRKNAQQLFLVPTPPTLKSPRQQRFLTNTSPMEEE